ncbi:MAG: NPCBM/NEW2 domain-containing protein [Clostridiales bacterium]|nr:NPCBM/NEW2 domain-containing protein [Clostridiales bacterium]
MNYIEIMGRNFYVPIMIIIFVVSMIIAGGAAVAVKRARLLAAFCSFLTCCILGFLFILVVAPESSVNTPDDHFSPPIISADSVCDITEGRLEFDYKRYADCYFDLSQPYFDEWPGRFITKGPFSELKGKPYYGIGMAGPFSGDSYWIKYNIPRGATRFSTFIFIDAYHKNKSYGTVTYQILVDGELKREISQSKVKEAEEIVISIPENARTLTLKITTTTTSGTTFDIVWGNPCFYHYH